MQKNKKKITGGQSLINSLYKEGVRVIFGLPGIQLYHAIVPILDYSDLKFITTRHEQATTYMADGYARASGKVGVAMVVPGPGLQNASAGITNAYASSSPVLIISGQINRDKISKDVGVLHEINDQMDIIKPITKWQKRILKANKISPGIKEAFLKIRTGRPRPVEIEIPPEALSDYSISQNYKQAKISNIIIKNKSLRKAAKILINSKKPVIWSGGGVHISEASKELLALAEYLQIPVITTAEGKGSISDKHFLSIGSPQGRSTGNSKDLLRNFFYTCDVILAVGTRFATAEAKSFQKVIQIDIDHKEIGRNHKNTLGIQGDARQALQQLLKIIEINSKPRKNKKAFFENMRSIRYDKTENQIEPLASYVKALRQGIPEDGIVVADMTTVAYYARVHYQTYNPRSYFTSSYSGNLGSAFPTSLGIKVAKPNKVVVSISGDGGFLFNSQELATAAQFGINVIAVVFNDESYGNVKRDMKKIFNNKFLGAELKNPNFIKLAESYGVEGMKAENPHELKMCIEKAIVLNKPVLIEVPTGETPSPF
jgi:acetolactate synthase-1/2/3 large subunit